MRRSRAAARAGPPTGGPRPPDHRSLAKDVVPEPRAWHHHPRAHWMGPPLRARELVGQAVHEQAVPAPGLLPTGRRAHPAGERVARLHPGPIIDGAMHSGGAGLHDARGNHRQRGALPQGGRGENCDNDASGQHGDWSKARAGEDARASTNGMGQAATAFAMADFEQAKTRWTTLSHAEVPKLT